MPNMRKSGPLLVAAAVYPPFVSGSSVVCRNLWGAWPAEDLVVVSHRSPGFRTDPALTVPGVTVRWIEPWPFRSARVAAHLDPLAAGRVTRALIETAEEFQPRAIWVNWPTTSFVLGAWRAARQLRLPFLVHLHDTWRETYRGRRRYIERLAASLFEGRILRAADRVFTLTEDAQDHYRKAHGIEPFFLAHAVPDADLVEGPPHAIETHSPAIIHYAGSIYPVMNQDAVVNLVRALDLCARPVLLECFTPNAESSLAQAGICGPHVRVRFGSKAEVMAAQRASDAVVLPLAFQSTNPVEIRTVFPTKLLEYFVCGRPILVHAPTESWASRNARGNGWGVVVDTLEPKVLAQAIDLLLDDVALQRNVVAAAKTAARRRLASAVAAGLRRELEKVCGPAPLLSAPATARQ